MADKDAWVASLRVILACCPRLETVFLATRPGGEALQELMYYASVQEGGMSALKRVTISSLSFSFPTLGVGLLEAPNLTHLHLIQWIPPTLSERFGSTLYQSLQSLRLSRIPSSAISRLPPIVFDEKSQEISAQQVIDRSILVSPQPLLLLLRECIEQLSSLEVVLLEIVDLGDLNMPENLTQWQGQEEVERRLPGAVSSVTAPSNITSTGGFGAPFDQFSAGHLGQLATLDFPADVPLTSEEGQEWAQRQEDSRCEQRILYWSQLLQFKNLLTRYSQEMRNSTDKNLYHNQLPSQPIEFRIVAPRALGWDRTESLIDFHANASACRSGEEDFSAFQDEDAFDLVNEFPHLGHDYGVDEGGKKVAYWTGSLPRPSSLSSVQRLNVS